MSQAKRIGNEGATTAESIERNASGADLWAHLRPQFSGRVQAIVDAAIAGGGVTLEFIALLELAEHERLIGEVEKLRAKAEFGHKVSTAISSLYSLRLQSRRHMRVLRIAMNPIATPNTMKHIQTAAMASKRLARAKPPDPNDTGDDLVN